MLFIKNMSQKEYHTKENYLIYKYESTRGLAEKRRTHDHQTILVVSPSPATASMFVSLGKIPNLNLLR